MTNEQIHNELSVMKNFDIFMKISSKKKISFSYLLIPNKFEILFKNFLFFDFISINKRKYIL